ncbi:MAG: hypothetical protein J0H66_08620 [Solirubrobacterales bacterium]|nr:hypothetical protein [Solirubrobacterales bacterium]OJU95854.1 MAG: hypothetical protein BGO23_09760 [Solirubrobacterales bacterium 67-14]
MLSETRTAFREQPASKTFTTRDEQLALEIAEFVADRAQSFSDHECRAWALTDFGVWAVLAGQSPKLSMDTERDVQLL